MTFHVLLVCTGNVCRSPMAERLLSAGLARRTSGAPTLVEFSSAGTRALVGEPMTEQTARLVAHHGGESGGHRARQLTGDVLVDVDLVLALTRAHRSDVVAAHPRLLRRAFTLREAARLSREVAGPLADVAPEDRWRALADHLAPARGRGTLRDPLDDDVVDPYRSRDRVYQQCADQVVPAITALLDVVAPLTPSPRPA